MYDKPQPPLVKFSPGAVRTDLAFDKERDNSIYFRITIVSGIRVTKFSYLALFVKHFHFLSFGMPIRSSMASHPLIT